MASGIEATPAQLFGLVGSRLCPGLIEFRIDADCADDPQLIPGAPRPEIRNDPKRLEATMEACDPLYRPTGDATSEQRGWPTPKGAA